MSISTSIQVTIPDNVRTLYLPAPFHADPRLQTLCVYREDDGGETVLPTTEVWQDVSALKEPNRAWRKERKILKKEAEDSLMPIRQRRRYPIVIVPRAGTNTRWIFFLFFFDKIFSKK